MSEMKKIISGWKKYHSQIEEMSRSYTIDPKTVDPTRLHQFANTQVNNKSDASLEQTVNDVLNAVQNNENVFISFVDRYDENVPSLGVSPEISYDTPHGIYGYPLDKHNVVQFLTTGMPTEADFATERDFFHLYTINDLQKIKIEVDSRTNYNDLNYARDLNNIIRMTIQYILSFKKVKNEDEVQKEKRKSLEDLERKHFGFKFGTSLFRDDFISFIEDLINNDYIYKLNYKFYGEDVYKRIDDKIIDIISRNLHDLSNTQKNTYYNRTKISKFYNLYFCIDACASIAAKVSGNQVGEMLTILLKSVNISAIDDDGTSLLHFSEPTQSVAMDPSNESGKSISYNLIGTYTNYFSEFIDIEFNTNYETLSRQSFVKSLIDKSLISGKIGIETVYPKSRKHDYNKIPVFKVLMSYIQKDFKEKEIKTSIFEVIGMFKELILDNENFGDTGLENSQLQRIDSIFSISDLFRKLKMSRQFNNIQHREWFTKDKKEIESKIFDEIKSLFDKESKFYLEEFYKTLRDKDKKLLNDTFETIKFNYIPALTLEHSLLKKYIQTLLS